MKKIFCSVLAMILMLGAGGVSAEAEASAPGDPLAPYQAVLDRLGAEFELDLHFLPGSRGQAATGTGSQTPSEFEASLRRTIRIMRQRRIEDLTPAGLGECESSLKFSGRLPSEFVVIGERRSPVRRGTSDGQPGLIIPLPNAQGAPKAAPMTAG